MTTLFDNLEPLGPPTHPLRKPCAECGHDRGVIRAKGQQDCVFCAKCDRYQYNAPRTETGKRTRSVTTVHNGIRPKQRARILERAHCRCEICHQARTLHVGHILDVDNGLKLGIQLTERQLNSDENLIAHCEECNLGQGARPLPLWLAIGLLLARVKDGANM